MFLRLYAEKRKRAEMRAMEKKNKVFAERLMLTRCRGLITQEELAEMVGVSGQTISAYERNIQTPSLDVAVGIADALGVSLDWLAGREEATTDMSRWISVEDRLPTSIVNKVIVRCKNGYVGFGHYEKYNGKEVWYNLESQKPFTDWDIEDCETYEITHWMPLPEPPREETK